MTAPRIELIRTVDEDEARRRLAAAYARLLALADRDGAARPQPAASDGQPEVPPARLHPNQGGSNV